MKSRREVIIEDTFAYTIAMYIANFIGFFNAIFIRRFLGPLYAGYWALLNVIQSYAGYFGLGTKVALNREIPQARGRGEEETITVLQNTVFSFLLIVSAIAAISIFTLSFFIFHDASLRIACLLLGLLIGLSHLYTLVISISQAKKEFALVSKVTILNACLVIIFSLSLSYRFKLIGLIAGLIISNTLAFFVSRRWAKIQLHFFLSLRTLKQMIAIGVPMIFAGVLYTTLVSVDRMMIGKFINVESVGFYSIALMASAQLEILPKFFNIVIFPHLQEDYGASGSLKSSHALILKSIYFTSRFMPFVLGAILFFMHPIVYYAIPKFIPGLGAMDILLFGFFFVVLGGIFPSVIYTVNKQIALIPIYLAAIAAGIGANYFCIKAGWGIEGVALGTSFSYLLFFLVISFYSAQYFTERKELFKIYFSISAYYIYFLTGIIVIKNVSVFGNMIATFFIQMACLCVISIPMFVTIQKKEKFFTSLLNVVRKQWAKTHGARNETI